MFFTDPLVSALYTNCGPDPCLAQLGTGGFVGVESFDRAALLQAHKGHNRPERYGDIVRLCRAHGITSHFSNILGFPGDTEVGVLEHLATLRELDPDLASFYVLTPMPGTEQYDELLAAGLIHETNLDRFDGTCPTWRHDRLSDDRLTALLARCYSEFYDARGTARRALRLLKHRDFRTSAGLFSIAGQAALARLAVRRRTHPMAGGVGGVRRDGLSDYLGLRKARYGLERASLPASLTLTPADREMDRQVRIEAGRGH